MSKEKLPVVTILAAGLGMGFIGDYLLRAPGEPGLNFALIFAAVAASITIVAINAGARLSREAVGWMVVGLLMGTCLLWRGAEVLRFFAFVSAAAAFTLPALHAGRGWVRSAGVPDLIEAGVASGLHTALGAARLLQRDHWETVGDEETHRNARTAARSVLVGILLAAVPLGIFGALFLSADPVFAELLEDWVKIDLAAFASHLALIALLSWFACGYLAGFSSGTRLGGLRTLGWEPPTLRTSEVSVAVGLVDLLFLAFVVVQFRYLFGGAQMVEVTPGLTYAAYAREGFFQLVVATALGIPWLLAAHGLLGKEESPRWTFQALSWIQLILLLAIVASALQRMRAYLEAYGLTEDRFVATAILLWLAVLVIWFGATVLRRRGSPFVFGVLASGYALIMVLHVANPTAYAARSQLDRAESALHQEPDSGSQLDATYLSRLGSDATPILLERMDELPPEARSEVANALLSRWDSDREWDWRNWNLADWRARRLVENEAPRLRAMVGEGEESP